MSKAKSAAAHRREEEMPPKIASAIPVDKRAVEFAKGRGLLFDPWARDTAREYFRYFQEREDATGGHWPTGFESDVLEVLKGEAGNKALQERDRAARWCRQIRARMLQALRALEKDGGEAAKQARGAMVDVMNWPIADDPREALESAMRSANAAARTYFVEHKRKRLDTRDEDAQVLKRFLDEKGLATSQGLMRRATIEEFAYCLAKARGIDIPPDKDIPRNILDESRRLMKNESQRRRDAR